MWQKVVTKILRRTIGRGRNVGGDFQGADLYVEDCVHRNTC